MTASISRRTLLRSGTLIAAAGAASTALPSSVQPQDALPRPIQLGIASYTFRNFTRAQLIGFLKDLNVSDLNVKDVKDHLPADIQEEARALADYAAAGIRLHAAGAIYFAKDEDEDIRAKFEYCKRAGIRVIVAGDPAPETLPRLEKFVREYDIRIAIHNHGPEDKLWPSPFEILKAIEPYDPRIGCCIDLGHAARAGANLVQAIHAAGPRLFNIHIKDLTDFKSKESQVAVGDGIMPIPAIFRALMAIRYDGFVDLEYEVHGDDPIPGVMRSMAYMRGVLAGMGDRNSA